MSACDAGALWLLSRKRAPQAFASASHRPQHSVLTAPAPRARRWHLRLQSLIAPSLASAIRTSGFSLLSHTLSASSGSLTLHAKNALTPALNIVSSAKTVDSELWLAALDLVVLVLERSVRHPEWARENVGAATVQKAVNSLVAVANGDFPEVSSTSKRLAAISPARRTRCVPARVGPPADRRHARLPPRSGSPPSTPPSRSSQHSPPRSDRSTLRYTRSPSRFYATRVVFHLSARLARPCSGRCTCSRPREPRVQRSRGRWVLRPSSGPWTVWLGL